MSVPDGRPYNVMVCAQAPDHYSTYVRAYLPMLHLKQRGILDFVIMGFDPYNPKWLLNVAGADVMFGIGADVAPWMEVFQRAQAQGKRVVVDFDDDKWNVNPLNYAYHVLGTKEVTVRDIQSGAEIALWRDGIDNFDIRRNAMTIGMVSEQARRADVVTASTSRMAEKVAEHNDRVMVLENCVDLDLWETHRMGRPGFRVGWQGGCSHKQDMLECGPQIGRFVRERPDVTFYVAGEAPPELRDHFPPEQLETKKWVNSDAYPHQMMHAGLDLGLAPLKDTSFNRGKSALKWNEFSAMAVPVACSDVPPYSDYVKHGEDGWLIPGRGHNGPTEEGRWYDFLCWAYDHRADVRAMGERARLRQERDFDARKRADEWDRVFRMAMEAPGPNSRGCPRKNNKLGGEVILR